jgi:hypothetical protein
MLVATKSMLVDLIQHHLFHPDLGFLVMLLLHRHRRRRPNPNQEG